jgi:hypothetical protein
MTSEVSAFQSTLVSFIMLVPEGPQPDWGREGFVLKTATAISKGCVFCNLHLLNWWQGIWGHPQTQVAVTRKAGSHIVEWVLLLAVVGMRSHCSLAEYRRSSGVWIVFLFSCGSFCPS